MSKRFLIGGEESQAITKAYRARWIEAYSCDLQECSGGHPEWHLQMDIFEAIEKHGPWYQIILHPPCTEVAVSGNGTYADTQERINAANRNAEWFHFAKKHCSRVAMEQPVTVLRTLRPELPRPQYVDLWWFGTKETKKTGWFLHGLPKLKADNVVGPPPKDKEERRKWMKTWMMTPSDDRGKLRSKLDPNHARAIAEQWQ